MTRVVSEELAFDDPRAALFIEQVRSGTFNDDLDSLLPASLRDEP